MEQLSGVPLTDLDSIRSITSRDPESVLIAALNTWFASVLGADTFHADVHAGACLEGGMGWRVGGWPRHCVGTGYFGDERFCREASDANTDVSLKPR